MADALEALRAGQQGGLSLPPDLVAWLDEQAALAGTTPAEVLAELVKAARDEAPRGVSNFSGHSPKGRGATRPDNL